MLSWYSLLLLAFSLSADAFAATISQGVRVKHPSLMRALRIGLIFGVVEGCMPLIGWLLGKAASTTFDQFDHWVAFTLLSGLGVKMIWESFAHAETPPPAHGWRQVLLASMATSIDALTVGATLAFMGANIWLAALLIGLCSALMATLGLMLGYRLGLRGGQWAERLGGLGLMAIGTAILIQHTIGW